MDEKYHFVLCFYEEYYEVRSNYKAEKTNLDFVEFERKKSFKVASCKRHCKALFI